MRTQLPLLICFFMGMLMLVQYFIPHPISQELFRRVVSWNLVIGVFAAVLGIGSLIHVHWERIRRRSANWRYSVIVFVGLFGMAIVGLVEGNLQPARKLVRTQTQVYEEGSYTLKGDVITLRAEQLRGRTLLRGDRIAIPLEDGRLAVAKVMKRVADADDDAEDGTVTATVKGWKTARPPESGGAFRLVRPGATVFHWLFDYVQVPLDATMFSLLAFFIASAAFRAFRARNVEATLLLVSAAVVMLGLTPPAVYVWDKVFSAIPGLPNLTGLKDWVLEVPNMASRRAIVMGVGLGAVAQSFRIILGIERTYLGGS